MLMTKFRLSWKGIMFISEALLYADADTPQFIILPIIVFLFLPKLFFSYLETSSTGIEVHYWPNYHLRVEWDEMGRLGKASFLARSNCDAIYLRNPQGETDSGEITREVGIYQKRLIALSDFRDWPKGGLRQELVRFIPEIMGEDA
jgi:hypothetical protein